MSDNKNLIEKLMKENEKLREKVQYYKKMWEEEQLDHFQTKKSFHHHMMKIDNLTYQELLQMAEDQKEYEDSLQGQSAGHSQVNTKSSSEGESSRTTITIIVPEGEQGPFQNMGPVYYPQAVLDSYLSWAESITENVQHVEVEQSTTLLNRKTQIHSEESSRKDSEGNCVRKIKRKIVKEENKVETITKKKKNS